jgi:hypothetical protein
MDVEKSPLKVFSSALGIILRLGLPQADFARPGNLAGVAALRTAGAFYRKDFQ